MLACAIWSAISPLSPALAQSQSAGCARPYVVHAGDWLARIAARAGLSWQALYANNRGVLGADPNRIFPGQVLCLVAGSGATPPTPPTMPPSPTPPPIPSSSGAISALEFCHSGSYWPAGAVSAWEVPASCYAGIYVPNANNYPYKPGFGWCNWWAEEIHPAENIFTAAKQTTPRVGAAVWFPPGDQGASSIGHWAGEIVAINGPWLLISEMNDDWRGAGFAKVNYRYIVNDGAIRFIY